MTPFHRRLAILVWLVLPVAGFAQKKFFTYVGDVGPDHALIAWGTTAGENTIGRSSRSHGPAVVRIDGKNLNVKDKNWLEVNGLRADTDYPYEVLVNGQSIAKSRIRTWPETSDKLRFFVIGDYGTGDANQRSVADAMIKEFQRLSGDNPVRFVITLGDNIYGTVNLILRFNGTGDKDSHWETRFFRPYQSLISQIPFYPSLGNHDGNDTENRGDLAAYLDNFFFPAHVPSRYYRFSYGGLADFFALDTTANTESGPPRNAFEKDGDEFAWLKKNLGESRTPWKIPYMHHPPFNAGPRHPSSAKDLQHFMDIFKSSGVKVSFAGHEHNFQFSKQNAETGNIRYVVSGAGGELRTGEVRDAMQDSNIEGWAAVLHFLSVEIDGREMKITPISPNGIEVVDKDSKKIPMPLRVTLD